MAAVSVIRNMLVLVNAALPAKNLSSAITRLQAYPLPGAASWGMSTAMLLAVCSCAAVRVSLNEVHEHGQNMVLMAWQNVFIL
jgi:hypothetical protein